MIISEKKYLISFLIVLLMTSCVSKEVKEISQLDRNGIRDTILNNRTSIRNCYGQALMKSGRDNLTGKVVLDFDIIPSGKTQNTRVNPQKTTLHNKQLQSCIKQNFNSWTFPTPPGGKTISVTYPLMFNDTPARNMQRKMDKFQNIRKSKK